MWPKLKILTVLGAVFGGESTLDLFYASSEEIPELQRPRRATGNRRNLQCGDDSILQANVTWDMGSHSLGAVVEVRIIGNQFSTAVLLMPRGSASKRPTERRKW